LSEEQDESSKTEEPTGKRIEKAHEEGQYATSREVNNWLMLVVATVLLGGILPGTMSRLENQMTWFIGESHQITMDAGGTNQVVARVMLIVLGALVVPLALMMVVGVAATVIQNGLHINLKPLTPDLNKLNPMNGLKRLFSLAQQGMEMLKNLFKITVCGVAAYFVMLPMLNGIELYTGMDALAMAQEIGRLSFKVTVAVLIVMTILTAGDIAWTRFDFIKKLRMTKQEIKDEYKQQEGDPIVKSRLRQMRIEKARQRMMAAVPTADVVVTNPTHYAVAMKYDPEGMNAPRVVAKGIDQVALNIRTVAEAHQVPLVENPPLARALYATVELEQEVPPEHYRAVAEIISYVFKLKGRLAGQ